MSKRHRRNTLRRSFPRHMSADVVKVHTGVNKPVHSDLYKKKRLDQELKFWALQQHANGEPRLAVLQRISDLLMAVPVERRLILEGAAGTQYVLMLCHYVNDQRQKVYFFARMFNTIRGHTLETSITYVSEERWKQVYNQGKIQWRYPPLDLKAVVEPSSYRSIASGPSPG